MMQPSKSVYLANTEGLAGCASHPVEAPGPGPSPSFTLEETRSGEQTILWEGKYLHSRYDPVKECADFFAASVPDKASTIIFFGWGAPYLTQGLLRALDACGEATRIYFMPTNIGLFFSTLHFFDYSEIFSDPRVTVITGGIKGLRGVTGSLGEDVETIVHPVSIKLASADLAPLRDILEEGFYGAFLTRRAEGRADELFERARGNLAAFGFDPGVASIFGSARSKTVVVAASGPSLKNDLSSLDVPCGSLYVCVDTSYRGLLQAGIDPDYTIAIDPIDILSRCFEGLDSVGALVYHPHVTSSLIEHWSGRRFVTFLSTDSGLDREAGEKGSLFCGGSVIHPAVDLAVRIGAKKIVLAGADFSFPGGYTHFDGAVFRRRAAGGPLMREIAATGGGVVPSSKALIAYLRELERYISKSEGVEWINRTCGGALISGTKRPG